MAGFNGRFLNMKYVSRMIIKNMILLISQSNMHKKNDVSQSVGGK